MKYVILAYVLLFCVLGKAQDNTRTSISKEKIVIGKIMLIPFEPKLYMSEIDKKVNEQTKWNFNQIRENFRHQLNEQLKLKLQTLAPVVSFYSDSVKMWKDLEYIYTSTSLSFDPIKKPSSAAISAQREKGIKNGQVVVEMNDEEKFMNVTISNTELLPYLHKKYKTDYFVFVNELDIKNDADSYNVATNTYQRHIAVHYTIIDKTGKLITAGAATSTFSSQENNPKKIVNKNFSLIAAYIVTKFSYVINPVSPVKTGK